MKRAGQQRSRRILCISLICWAAIVVLAFAFKVGGRSEAAVTFRARLLLTGLLATTAFAIISWHGDFLRWVLPHDHEEPRGFPVEPNRRHDER
jgi:hypothetical protein